MKKKNLNNFSYTFIANFINLLGGVISVLLIPKFLNIDEFAYLKIFTLYLTYVGIFHFGFNDGIYIRYGNYDYDDLEKKKVSANFKFLVIVQTLISVSVMLIALFIIKEPLVSNIWLVIAINIFLVNVSGFLSFISQVTKEFKLYARSMIIGKVTYIVGIVVVIFLGNKSHIIFMWLTTLGNALTALILILRYRELILTKSEKIKNVIGDIKENYKIGFFIMIGNFVSLALLGLDRIFVEKLFTLQEFAMYSFAFSVITMFYMISNTLATVVYPYITRFKKEELGECYVVIKNSCNFILAVTISGYFVIDIFVRMVLPDYIDSIEIIRILTPTILISGQISVTVINYYKAMKFNKEYIKNNVIALILALILNIVAYLIFKTPESIAWASLGTFIIWSFYSDIFFMKKLNIKLFKSSLLQIIIVIIFLLCSYIENKVLGISLYLVALVILLIKFYFKQINIMINKLK
ncbi:oligosaccharide flippase family protein [Clostridium gasigenes]|uniref:Oligosaccharide flippase family protein n=1 Tax=Clostridium gasigenes TaxID=94869 RepID=A0A7X0SBV0_9CLOT|nr:oligosaccharide flippase family protein [Clostridium gasigenes]MBB6713528.1 oligosaccharide flippase family protein [Clostridium gasigenes]